MKSNKIQTSAVNIKKSRLGLMFLAALNSFNKRRKIYIILLIIIVVLATAVSLYFGRDNSSKVDNDAATKQEIQRLVHDVSKIMELPQNEEPNVATVIHKDQLQDQDFFKKAENGDKIIIYAAYKMAILYRPSTHKIIKVAPLVYEQKITDQATTTSDINIPALDENGQPVEP